MTKKIFKADIDFERDLRITADIFRGAVAENHYRYDVLSLILIKRLSDRYELRKEELQHKLEDPQSNYNNIDKEEMSFVLEYADESLPKNIRIMPKEASRQYLLDNAGQDDITVKVDDALGFLQEVQEANKSGNPDLSPRISVKGQRTPRQMGRLIKLLSRKKFTV